MDEQISPPFYYFSAFNMQYPTLEEFHRSFLVDTLALTRCTMIVVVASAPTWCSMVSGIPIRAMWVVSI